MSLTKRETEVLEKIPEDSWVGQIELGTSKLVMKKLCSLRLVESKITPNPSQNPKKGRLYRKKATD